MGFLHSYKSCQVELQLHAQDGNLCIPFQEIENPTQAVMKWCGTFTVIHDPLVELQLYKLSQEVSCQLLQQACSQPFPEQALLTDTE